MSSFPYISFFISTLVLGSLISLSSSNWLLIWIGLELNLLSFVPLLNLSKSNLESEARIKYFLSQALGSGLLLRGALNLYFAPQTLVPCSFSNIFILLGLLTKLGMPPCHFWFPAVISSISWPMCFILSTWQKIVPLFLIIYSSFLPSFIFLALILTSSLIRGLGGINQNLIKSIIAYSSIGHISWIIAGSLASFSASLLYFLIYSLISVALLSIFNFSSSSSLLSLSSVSFNAPAFTFSLLLTILSLGGIPPFLGFFPKWLIIQTLAPINILVVIILLIGSIINLFYYLNILFISLISSQKPLLLPSKSQTFFPSFSVILRTCPLFLAPFFTLLIYAMIILN